MPGRGGGGGCCCFSRFRMSVFGGTTMRVGGCPARPGGLEEGGRGAMGAPGVRPGADGRGAGGRGAAGVPGDAEIPGAEPAPGTTICVGGCGERCCGGRGCAGRDSGGRGALGVRGPAGRAGRSKLGRPNGGRSLLGRSICERSGCGRSGDVRSKGGRSKFEMAGRGVSGGRGCLGPDAGSCGAPGPPGAVRPGVGGTMGRAGIGMLRALPG
jgi:hypothetical protein